MAGNSYLYCGRKSQQQSRQPAPEPEKHTEPKAGTSADTTPANSTTTVVGRRKRTQ